ncbi:hypothetical protein CBL_11015 [Carabus blaptoides fortunei]
MFQHNIATLIAPFQITGVQCKCADSSIARVLGDYAARHRQDVNNAVFVKTRRRPEVHAHLSMLCQLQTQEYTPSVQTDRLPGHTAKMSTLNDTFPGVGEQAIMMPLLASSDVLASVTSHFPDAVFEDIRYDNIDVSPHAQIQLFRHNHERTS